MKNKFAISLNANKPRIRGAVYANNIEKNKFKQSDSMQLDEQAYGVLLDIDNFLDKEHGLKMIFDDEQDFKNTIESIKLNFELYVSTKQKFLKKMGFR